MPNEARRKLDMPDAEGGDELFANGNIVPLTMAGAAYQKGGQPEETAEPEQPEENEPDAGQQVTEENEPDDTDEGQDGEEQRGGE